jgi:beta-glucosidase
MQLARLFALASVLAVFLAATFAALTRSAAQKPAPGTARYRNPQLSPGERSGDLLERMTLEEKAALLSGSGWMESAPIPRLGIPAIKMTDGPMGVRSWRGSSAITSGAERGKD